MSGILHTEKRHNKNASTKTLSANMKHLLILPVILIFIFTLAAPTSFGGKRLHKEREYQEAWCNAAGGA
jgi:hypothetical protein